MKVYKNNPDRRRNTGVALFLHLDADVSMRRKLQNVSVHHNVQKQRSVRVQASGNVSHP